MSLAVIFYYLLVLYFIIGLGYSIWYMLKPMARRDEDTRHTPRSVKSVFVPGLILTWPVTIIKWQKPIESYSNAIQPLLNLHLFLWAFLAITLPVITLIIVLHIPKEFQEKPIRLTSLIEKQNIIATRESTENSIQLRGLAPDDLQLKIKSNQTPLHPAEILVLNKDNQWLMIGAIGKQDSQLFSLPSGLIPGGIQLAIRDRKTNQLIQKINF
ncbi:MAG: hypothetical protein ABIR66_11650 [Saprospiraceae bacterium]